MRFWGLILLVLLACGCESTFELRLAISDPCNQSLLTEAGSVELVVSAPTGEMVLHQSWPIGDRSASLAELPLDEAIDVSVFLHKAATSDESSPAFAGALVEGLMPDAAVGEVVKVRAVLGRFGSFVRTTDREDVRQCTELTQSRRGHTATLMEDGRVWLVGGMQQDAEHSEALFVTEFFEPETGLFTEGPNLRSARFGHTATTLQDGRILIIGGEVLEEGEDPADVYYAMLLNGGFDADNNPADLKLLPLGTRRSEHTATLLPDGRVLIAGGVLDGQKLNSTEIFDPTMGRVTAGPTFVEGRSHHGAVVVGSDMVALVGGQGIGGPLANIELVRLDTHDVAVSDVALETARSHAVVAFVAESNLLLVAGGFAGQVHAPEQGVGIDSVELIRIAEDGTAVRLSCALAPRLLESRGGAAYTSTEGGFLVIGGVNADGAIVRSAELVHIDLSDPCAVRSTETNGSLSLPRVDSQLTTLPGGHVLVTGGVGFLESRGLVTLDEAELYTIRAP